MWPHGSKQDVPVEAEQHQPLEMPDDPATADVTATRAFAAEIGGWAQDVVLQG